MRIGYDARHIGKNRTGLGNYSGSLLQELISIGRDHEFVLFYPESSLPEGIAAAANVSVVKVASPELPGNGRIASLAYEQLWLPLAQRQTRIDLVHYPYYLNPLAGSRPFLITVHDMDTFSSRARHSLWTRAYHNSIIRMLGSACATLITDSEFSREEILRHLSIEPRKIRVVYPGVSGRKQATPTGVKSSENMTLADPDQDYFLYTGGLGMRKNLRRMVTAFSRARQATNSGTVLVITGGLEEVGRALVELVHQQDLEDGIVFTGYLSDEELSRLYQGASCVLYPSLYEGFGLPVIEAMSYGVPVITSSGGSMQEIGGDGAVLVDPLDTSALAAVIGALMTDRQLARSWGRSGPDIARRFSWRTAAEQCLEIYEEMLS